jgi:Zn-dependent protease with chaperone function
MSAVRYANETYTGFREYAQRAERGGLGMQDAPRYAVEIDDWIVQALNSLGVRSVMSQAMDTLVSFQFGQEIASSITISRRSFPDLYEVLVHCARTLGIPTPHAVSRHDPALFNAYTSGTDEYAFINISSTLLQLYTREEATFVVGHECGHIAARHVMYQTLINVLTDVTIMPLGALGASLGLLASVPLLAWSRRAELTADRAGLLCCGDLQVAERALVRLVAGFATPDRLAIDDLLARAREAEQFHALGQWRQYFQSHPLIPKRIVALRLFANSELYYELTGRPRPAGQRLLTHDELRRQVALAVKP